MKTAAVIALGITFCPHALHAQAVPMAYRPLRLGAFAGATGVDTGLLSGKNGSITAGVNLAWDHITSYRPAIELRGTLPVDRGNIDGQKNVLGGLRISHPFGRFEPYADVLIGLGQLRYRPLRPNPQNTFQYDHSSSTVYDFGGGADIGLTRRFGLKLDFQAQHYGVPVTASSHIWAKAGTIGVNYFFF